MLRQIKTILVVGITSSTVAIAPQVMAQQKQKCYMINSSGDYIDLSSLCYARPSQTVNNNNNSFINPHNPQPREVIREIQYPRYDVRNYFDYGFDRDSNVKFSQPYFNSYRYYTHPVPVPYYGSYYHPGGKFGIGYSNGNFGVGFGYNFAPQYRHRGDYHRYRTPYRDRSGRYYYNRNGMKVRFR